LEQISVIDVQLILETISYSKSLISFSFYRVTFLFSILSLINPLILFQDNLIKGLYEINLLKTNQIKCGKILSR